LAKEVIKKVVDEVQEQKIMISARKDIIKKLKEKGKEESND
jgi:hypothetical protein